MIRCVYWGVSWTGAQKRQFLEPDRLHMSPAGHREMGNQVGAWWVHGGAACMGVGVEGARRIRSTWRRTGCTCHPRVTW